LAVPSTAGKSSEELNRREERKLVALLGNPSEQGIVIRPDAPDEICKLILVDKDGQPFPVEALEDLTTVLQVDIITDVIAERAHFLAQLGEHMSNLAKEKLKHLQDSKSFAVMENDSNPAVN
jgi:hypothetical protein